MNIDLDRIARRDVLPETFGHLRPVPAGERPVLALLGGQPAAGKSHTQAVIMTRHPNMAGITGDDFRRHHPDFEHLVHADPLGMPAKTSEVSGPLVRRCLDHALGRDAGQRYSALLEGVFTNPEMVASTITEFSQAGFDVHVYAMAVPEHASRLSAEHRYLTQAATQPDLARWTPPTAHDNAYAKLPDSLAVLEQHPSVQHLEVWTRTGVLYAADRANGVWPGNAVGHLEAGRAQAIDATAWAESYTALRHVAESARVPMADGFTPIPYLSIDRVQQAWAQLDEHARSLGLNPTTLPPSIQHPRALAQATFPAEANRASGQRTGRAQSRLAAGAAAETTLGRGDTD